MASTSSQQPATAGEPAAPAVAPSNDAAASSVSAADQAAGALAAARISTEGDAAHTDAVAEQDDADEEEEEDDDPNAPPVNPLSDSDSDSDNDADSSVALGFLEEAEHPRALLRHYFPCKVGGKPAWLNPRTLPSSRQLQCPHCANPMTFLLQVYSPLRTTYGSHTDSFHRTLFLFCCLEEACSNKQRSVLCLRSQLPRHNPFYPSEAAPKLPLYELAKGESAMPVLEDPTEADVHLCCVCGCAAPSSCSRCHSRRYCSKLHQLYDWKQGKHKTLCVPRDANAAAASSTDAAAAPAPPSAGAISSLLFPQKEIVIEPENMSDSEDEDEEGEDGKDGAAGSGSGAASGSAAAPSNGKGKGKAKGDFSKEQRLLEAYEKEKAESKDGAEEEEEDAREVEATAANWNAPGKLKDPLFTKFKLRVERAPDQVLRYDRAAGESLPTDGSFQPLWVSTWYQPASPPMPPVAPQKPGQKPSPPPRPVAPTPAANDAAIPCCARCGGARRFEFQVLPQLLYYLGPLGSGLDFATVAVYTCSASCGDGVKDGYIEEFAWVQAHAQ